MSEHFPKPKSLRANGKAELDLYQQVLIHRVWLKRLIKLILMM